MSVLPSMCAATAPSLLSSSRMLTLCETDGIDDGAPAVRVPEIVVADVSHQLRCVHPRIDIAGQVIAVCRASAGHVGLVRREDGAADEVSAVDQLLHLRPFHHYVEVVAETATVRPAGRGAQAEYEGVRVSLYDLAPRRGDDMVRLVHHDQARWRQFQSARPDVAGVCGLNADNLYQRLGVAGQIGFDVAGGEGGGGGERGGEGAGKRGEGGGGGERREGWGGGKGG